MQRQITTNISIISAFAVAISGLCAEQALAGGSDCTTGSVVKVCVEWSKEFDPVESFHYFVDFTDASNPDVDLKTADLAWVVYATLVSNGNPANIGTLTLRDPTPSGEDFELTIANGAGAGAANVGTINLTDAGFTGYSSIEGGHISGNLTGGLTVVQDSVPAGGELTLTVDGDVSGAITVPVLKSLLIGGDLSANITVTDKIKGGTLAVAGSVTSAVAIDIADMVSDDVNASFLQFGNETPPGLEFAGDLLLNTGVKADTFLSIYVPLTSTAVIDLNGADVAGGIDLAGGDGDIIDGGAVTTSDFWLIGSGTEPYSGTATFDTITSSGLVRTEAGLIDGEFHILGDLEGQFGLQGDLLPSGRLTVDGTVSGSIVVGTGGAFDGNMEGTITVGEDIDGFIGIEGDVTGDVSVSGDITSSGSVTVDGALANGGVGGGRILVFGETSGAIKVGEKTGSLTLIHAAGGLATGGTIEINTTEGKFYPEGDIQIGWPGITPLPPVTFDGCIRIYDDNGVPPAGGVLKGDLTVSGCHATDDDLNICVDVSDNGKIFIVQNGCTNQVGWSCDTCP